MKNQKLANNEQSEKSIVFCIDNSGSMNSSLEIEGKVELKHGLTEDELNSLKQFIDPGDEEQIWYNDKKNTTWVSRRQCVLAAIESQINDLKNNNPKKKVGIVTFNNEVIIIGDGTEDPEIITGDKLYKKTVNFIFNLIIIVLIFCFSI